MSIANEYWCRDCHTSHALQKHLPLYKVWDEEHEGGEEYAQEVRAVDAEFAAERYADDTDSDREYSILRGDGVKLNVRGPDGKLTVWEVTGESVPQYSARQVEPATDRT